MNNNDRTFIAERLAAGEDKSSIASSLLMRRALEDVEKIAQDMAQAEARQQFQRDHAYYTVLGPQPQPVKVRDEGGVELFQMQGRQQYRVLVKDFAVFCREMKLDHKKMEAVATGQQPEHRGWISGGYAGRLYDMTGSYMPPTCAEDQAAPEPKEKRLSVYQATPDPITYTPAK